MVLFIMLYKVIITFESVDDILKYDNSDDSYCSVSFLSPFFSFFFMYCTIKLKLLSNTFLVLPLLFFIYILHSVI